MSVIDRIDDLGIQKRLKFLLDAPIITSHRYSDHELNPKGLRYLTGTNDNVVTPNSFGLVIYLLGMEANQHPRYLNEEFQEVFLDQCCSNMKKPNSIVVWSTNRSNITGLYLGKFDNRELVAMLGLSDPEFLINSMDNILFSLRHTPKFYTPYNRDLELIEKAEKVLEDRESIWS